MFKHGITLSYNIAHNERFSSSGNWLELALMRWQIEIIPLQTVAGTVVICLDTFLCNKLQAHYKLPLGGEGYGKSYSLMCSFIRHRGVLHRGLSTLRTCKIMTPICSLRWCSPKCATLQHQHIQHNRQISKEKMETSSFPPTGRKDITPMFFNQVSLWKLKF